MMSGLYTSVYPFRFNNANGYLNETFEQFHREYHEWFSHVSLNIDPSDLFEKNVHVGLTSIVSFENYPTRNYGLNLPFEITFDTVNETNQYGLSLDVVLRDNYRLFLTYDRSQYNKYFVCALLEKFVMVLQAFLNNSNIEFSTIDYLSLHEKELMFPTQGKNEFCNKNGSTIVHDIWQSNESNLEKTAVKYLNKTASYGELFYMVDALYESLIKLGVQKNSIVALYLSRSIEMIASILAIMKIGAAYLPLSITDPISRIKYIIQESNVQIILTNNTNSLLLQSDGIQIVDFNHYEWSCQNDFHPILCQENDAAYVIYTSGSTGVPKGVINEHRALLNRIKWMKNQYHINKDDVILQKTTYTFDVSVWELFLPLLSSATLVFLENGGEKDPRVIANEISKRKISVMHFVPTAFSEFLNYIVSNQLFDHLISLRYIFTSGEALLINHMRLFRDINVYGKCKLVNLYGPTEAAVDVTYYDSTLHETEYIPIGRPIDNVKIYILDRYLSPQPAEAVGEIYIGGVAPARGYLNQIEMTADKFILSPFDNTEILYKSGDLAKWIYDAENKKYNIQYLCRKDNQVKIHGFRIEIDEVRNVLLSYPHCDDCVVIVEKNHYGESYLIAFYTGSKSIDKSQYIQYARQALPYYMVPGEFYQISDIPMLPNGKADHFKIKELIPKDANQQFSAFHKSNLNQVEEQIQKIWEQELGNKIESHNDNFFDVGGNSLSVLRVREKLEDVFHKSITPTQMFEYSTIHQLACYFCDTIEEEKAQIEIKRRQKDIAVIGMSGGFPGAKDVNTLWENLKACVEARTEISKEELEERGVEAELLNDPRYVRSGMFFDGAEEFDAGFFGLSKREAEIMDPQHRKFLEFAWGALEDGGYIKKRKDESIGVFGSCSMSSYLLNYLMANRDHIEINGELGILIGNDKDFLATRVSYLLGLKGPAVTIQTACSSSLSAVHYACESIRDGTCNMALAGGVSIRMPQGLGYLYKEGGILSPDGHCRPYDNKARGTVNGNGGGVVLLKDLKQAEEDGDIIYGVIKSSAINNDGERKVGFTAPSIQGQLEVLKKALANSGLKKEDIGYVEGHGTGTEMGDPIEVEALEQVYGGRRKEPCILGSIKSNIGHMDAASGIAGLIKAIKVVEEGIIPGTVHYNEGNEKIRFEKKGLRVSGETREWKDKNRFAGVSSFGMGGTNVHIIVGNHSMPMPAKAKKELHENTETIVFSAKNEKSLAEYIQKVSDYLKVNPESKLSDVAYTQGKYREVFEYRTSILSETTEDLISKLDAWDQRADKVQNGKVVFMFTGQGSEYTGMGKALYETEPEYREDFDRIREQVLKETRKDIREYILGDKENIGIQMTQILLFGIEYCTARMWMRMGLVPDGMIGHSIGEFGAACISGLLDEEEAVRMVLKRGELMEATEEGRMLAVWQKREEAERWLDYGVNIAAVNESNQVVLSGKKENIEKVWGECQKEEILCTMLRPQRGFHSELMEQASKTYAEYADSVKKNKMRIPYVSCVTGDWINEEEITGAYWGRHMRDTVQYLKGMETLHAWGGDIYVEVGPGETLSQITRRMHKKEKRVYSSIPSEKQKDKERIAFKKAAGEIWSSCGRINWDSYYQSKPGSRLPLPTYSFLRTNYGVSPILRPSKSNDVDKVKQDKILTETNISQDINYTEKVLIYIWEKLFGIGSIKPTDDFYDLNGNSLIAIQMMSQIHELFQIDLPVSKLFEYSTIQDLVKVMYENFGHDEIQIKSQTAYKTITED